MYYVEENTTGLITRGNSSSSSDEDPFLIEYILWDVLYGVLCIPTVTGNILILMSLSKFRETKSSIHILIGNLAVSDLIVGAIVLPYCIVLDLLQLNSEKYPCLIKSSLMVLAIGVTCYGLLLISIDRFSAVCFPFRHHRTLSTVKIGVMLAIGWMFTSVFAVFPVTGWNFYDKNLPYNCIHDKVLTPIYQKVMNGIFIIILSINVFLYITVVKISMKNARKVHIERNNSGDFHMYRVKTMAMVQGLFAICWLPYVVLNIALAFSDNPVLQEIEYWTLLPGIFNSCINWIIYGYRNKDVRKEIHKHLKCNIFKIFLGKD